MHIFGDITKKSANAGYG